MDPWSWIVLWLVVDATVMNQHADLNIQQRADCPRLYCKCERSRHQGYCTGVKQPLSYIPTLPDYVEIAIFNWTTFPNITRSFLSNLTRITIKKLSFVKTNTVNIAQDAFVNLNHLTQLEISRCPKLPAKAMSLSLKGAIKVESVIFTENNWTVIPEWLFSGFQNSVITKIDLRHNYLQSVNGTCFSDVHSLEYLYLSHNRLTFLNTNGLETTNITHLYLAHNRFNEIPCFCGPSVKPTGRFKTIDFTANPIYHIDSASFQCLDYLHKLTLDQTLITKLEDNLLTFVPRLQSLSISQCMNHLTTIQPFAFNCSSLLKLVFSRNMFKFSKLNAKTYKNIFKFLPKLGTLELSDNDLSLTSYVLKQMFSPLKKVKKLVLQNVGLKEMPRNVFTRMPSLEFLSIIGNKLTGWNDNSTVFGNTTSIQNLQLNGNNIKLVNKTSFPTTLLRSLRVLSISNNPFACTCDLLWFSNWIKTTNITILNYPKQYKCSSPPALNGKLLRDYNPTVEMCSYVDRLLQNVCIGIAVTFIVMTVAVSLGYRYKFYLKYWLHVLGIRRMGYQRIEDDSDYQFDAFVIYCQADCRFVYDYLIPELEGKSGCRLCIHSRDFEVGRFIFDNITRNIELSRNVILVLSNAFLDSEWCRYELTLTQARIIHEGPGVLSVIVLEEIKPFVLPSAIRSILDTVTYNEWPQADDGRRQFWGRLLAALNRMQITDPMY